MAQVQFTVNELTTRDFVRAAEIESEIRAAAASFVPEDAVLQCRVLVETGALPEAARVRIQFEKPGWIKSFGLALDELQDLRRAAHVVLGAGAEPEG